MTSHKMSKKKKSSNRKSVATPIVIATDPRSIDERLDELGPPAPGVIKKIPISLYPYYIQRYGLQIRGSSLLGNVYVKRGEK